MSFQVSSKINNDVSREILLAVEQLKQGSGFGSIEIVLHEGRVTQIEKREKFRFSNNENLESKRVTPSIPVAAK
jgi:hypothetical protein